MIEQLPGVFYFGVHIWPLPSLYSMAPPLDPFQLAHDACR
jgi:hypothetical protein